MTVTSFEGATWKCSGCELEKRTKGSSVLPPWWCELKYQQSVAPPKEAVVHFCSMECLMDWAGERTVEHREESSEPPYSE